MAKMDAICKTIKSSMFHIDLIILYANIKKFPANIRKLHVNIIILHVEMIIAQDNIIYLAYFLGQVYMPRCYGQKYATISGNYRLLHFK